ncbi:MAG TPA: tetratricopeptide repeat protein [Acidobacteriaceae bacterium]|nr:tetratricopeptide repeat protein [Acidobacteriaceae bacterium]
MRRLEFSFRTTFPAIVLAATCWVSAAAQAVDQNSQVLQLIRNGGDAIKRGDLPGAETIFHRAVDRAPTLSDAYLGLGLVQLRRGERDDATKSLARAVELNPQLHGAHLFLGIAQYQAGQPELAAASLRAEIALAPNNSEALTWLGIVELGQGHPEQATGPLDQAAALTPKDPHVLYYQARAHMLVSESVFRQLSALDPDSALVHRGMAESYDVSGQTEKAIAEYEVAVKKDPTSPDLYEALGDADLKISRVDAAQAAYQEELKLNPHSPIALYNLGRMDVERGKPESGVALLRQAEAAHASSAPADFYLGLGLAEMDRNAEAAQWLERSLANRPSPFILQGAWYQLGRVYQKLGRKADAAHALEQLKQLLVQAQAQKEVTAKQAADQSAPPLDAPAPPRQP